MKRSEKYPDTDTFTYVNTNSHNRKSQDCVIRAIAYALSQSWETTVREMTEMGIKKGYVANDDWTVDHYLESKGWIKHKQPRKFDNTKLTMKEFVSFYPNGLYIVRMAGHLTVVDYGKNVDIWDCVKYGGCAGCYYSKAQGGI